MIGNARIVGLGEATHGSHEIFQMKDRLVRFLASQMSFTVFAIEANMPEAYRLNEYVLYGKGDPKALIKGMYFWTWDTQEVLNMVKWMRKFNASGKGKIEFTGFDMQFPTAASQSVRDFVQQAEPGYLPTLNNAYQVVRDTYTESRNAGAGFPKVKAEQWKKAAQKIYEHLKAKRDDYLSKADVKAVDWVIQNARVVLQGAEMFLPDGPLRDESMAENIKWITQQNPEAKIVLWAHNGHIAKSSSGTTPMAAHLAKHFGKGYISLGTAFYRGEYNSNGSKGLTAYPASPACPGSIGAVFHAVGEPTFLVDLRQVTDSPKGAWLLQPHDFRLIGAVVEPDYESIILAKAFDLVIFIDKVTASHFLP